MSSLNNTRVLTSILRHDMLWFIQYPWFPAHGRPPNPQPRLSSVVSINCTLCLDALVSRHHKSRPLRTHRSLPALRSARQPACYATAHSTTQQDHSPTQTLSATFYPSSAPAVSPSSSLRSSSYSLKTIRTIARCSVSNSRNPPATNGGKSG